MKIKNVAGTLVVLLVVSLLITMPVLAGGYVRTGSIHRHISPFPLTDEYLASQFANSRFISGISPVTGLESSLDTDFNTEISDFKAKFTDYNAYFALTQGAYALRAGDEATPDSKDVTVKMYILMPGEFKAVQDIDMQFLKEDLTGAKVTTTLTYRGKTYEFEAPEKKENGNSIFNLFLYPFCEEFEKVGLVKTEDMTSTFDSAVSSGGMDYSGTFTIQAIKD